MATAGTSGAAGGAASVAGQTSNTGGADSSAGAGGEPSQAGSSSSGGATSEVSSSAVAECKTGGGEAYCKDAAKPHYWECPEATSDTAPAAGCSKAATDIPARWCCPDPICSSYAGGDQLCGALYTSQPHGYICTPDAPGTKQCQQPNPIATPQLYCCN